MKIINWFKKHLKKNNKVGTLTLVRKEGTR